MPTVDEQVLSPAAFGGASGSFFILTRIGVHIPDVCWTRDASRFDAVLAAGASEVIVVELDRRVRCFNANSKQPASAFGLVLKLPPG